MLTNATYYSWKNN